MDSPTEIVQLTWKVLGIKLWKTSESSSENFSIQLGKFQNPARKISESSSENFHADPGRNESGSPPEIQLLKLFSWLGKFRNKLWKIYKFRLGKF
jgi:hypothetical protein